MMCSNLLCFDSSLLFLILFSCLRLQKCSFSSGQRVFSEVEHRVLLGLVFGLLRVFSMVCLSFVCVSSCFCFAHFFNFAICF